MSDPLVNSNEDLSPEDISANPVGAEEIVGNDNAPTANADISYVTARRAAHSDDAEVERMLKELGPSPVENQAPNRQPTASAEVASPDSPVASKDGNIVDEFNKKQASRLEAGKQVNAGFWDEAGDVLQAVNKVNPSFVMAQGLDSWMQKMGITHIDAIPDDDKPLDLGGYFAPKPVTEQERADRAIGKIGGQVLAFYGGGELAGATNLASSALGKLGASGLANIGVAYAAMDPHESMIAGVIKNHPILQSSFTNWLADRSTGPEPLNRFKNAIEQAGLDIALVPVALGLGLAVKAGRAHLKKLDLFNTTETVAENTVAKESVVEAATPVLKEGEEVATSGSAPISTDTPDLPEIKAGEGVNADTQVAKETQGVVSVGENVPRETPVVGQSKNPGVIYAGKADLYPSDIVKRPLSGDEIKAFKEKFNLKTVGMADSPLTESILKTGDAFDAAKSGVVPDEEMINRAIDKAIRNPQEIIDAATTGKMSAEDFLAAKIRTTMAHEVYSKALTSATEALTKTGRTSAEFTAAAADAKNALDGVKYWMGNTKGIGANVARGLRGGRTEMVEGAGQLIDKLELNKDTVKLAFGTPEEAETTIQILKALDEKVAQDAVKHSERRLALIKAMRYGSVQTAAENILYQNLMALHTIGGKAQADITMGAMKPFRTAAAASLSHVSDAVDSVANLVLQNFTEFGSAEKYIPKENLLGLYKNYEPTTEELLEAYERTSIENITDVEIAQFKRAKNMRASFRQAGYEAYGLATGLWQEGLGVLKNAANRYARGDRSIKAIFPSSNGVTLKNSFEALSPEEWSKLTNYEIAVYYGSHFSPITDGLQNVTGYFQAVLKNSEKYGYAWKWAQANAKNEEDAALMFGSLLNEPNEPIQQMMMRTAQENTFTLDIIPGSITDKTTKVLNEKRWARRLIAPFTKINANMMSEALQSTGGLGFLSKRTKAAMAAGGEAREMAIAKQAFGTTLLGIFGYWASQGNIIGGRHTDPSSRKILEAKGAGPHTFKFGDSFYSSHFLGTLGQLMDLAADANEVYSYIHETDDVMTEHFLNLTATSLAVAIDNASPSLFTKDIPEFLDYVRDPKSYESQNYIKQKAQMFTPIPFAGSIRDITRTVDPVKRDSSVDPHSQHPAIEAMWNDLKEQLPGLSKSLPAEVGMWGQEVQWPSMLGLGPANATDIWGVKDKDKSVEFELLNLHMANDVFKVELEEGEKQFEAVRPMGKVKIGNAMVQLNPQQKRDYQKLSAGDMRPLAEAGLLGKEDAEQQSKNNLREELKAYIKTDEYNALTEDEKKVEIATRISDRRIEALWRLREMYPQIEEDAQFHEEQRQNRLEGKPVIKLRDAGKGNRGLSL